MDFSAAHILSVSPFQREDIERIFAVADTMQPLKQPFARRERSSRVLEGAILGNLFFEPSTRTRMSFGCAFNLLGGYVRETTDMKTSAMAKGESLYDTARVISGYCDVIVMRHPVAGSVAEFAEASRVPVINGGDGANEHPTQALLDLYTIRQELQARGKENNKGSKNSIDGMRIALLGDLKHGRTVHSLCRLLPLYKNITCTLIAPSALRMPKDIVDSLQSAGHKVVETEEMEQGIGNQDILYLTRIQEERIANLQEAETYQGKFRLNHAVYTKFCQPETIIMHPLPRDSRPKAQELSDDLNDHPNLAIFRQTDNGVLIRMALFALLLGVDDKVV